MVINYLHSENQKKVTKKIDDLPDNLVTGLKSQLPLGHEILRLKKERSEVTLRFEFYIKRKVGGVGSAFDSLKGAITVEDHNIVFSVIKSDKVGTYLTDNIIKKVFLQEVSKLLPNPS